MNAPKRVETGKVQIGDDWPGVFIRGDHALHDARTLRAFLDGADHLINRAVLSGLADTLASAEARNGIDPVMLCRRDPAVILAAARELPEVKALVEALDDAVCAWNEHQKSGDHMEGWWVSGARDALAALKPDAKG